MKRLESGGVLVLRRDVEIEDSGVVEVHPKL
jgi:hypothetical protein